MGAHWERVQMGSLWPFGLCWMTLGCQPLPTRGQERPAGQAARVRVNPGSFSGAQRLGLVLLRVPVVEKRWRNRGWGGA